MRRVGKCVCAGSATAVLLLGILLGDSTAKAQDQETELPQDRKVEFLTKEQTFFLSLGDSASLPCKIVQSDEDEFIKVWIRNKDILFAGNFRVDTDPRISLGPEGELKINGLVQSDDAVYTCKVNSQIEPNSIQHKIVLPGPPKVSTIPPSGEVTVMKGEPLYLGCTASGKPDSTITWRHMVSGLSSPRTPKRLFFLRRILLTASLSHLRLRAASDESFSPCSRKAEGDARTSALYSAARVWVS